MLCCLTVERWEILIRCSKERARTQNSWPMRATLGRESSHPAEWSQLTPWPIATLQLLQQLSKSPILGTCLAVSLASYGTTPLAFGPCCPTQHCLLDHKLNQEPVPISPLWTLTCTWLMQSCQALWRTSGPGRTNGRPGSGLVHHIGHSLKLYAVETRWVI